MKRKLAMILACAMALAVPAWAEAGAPVADTSEPAATENAEAEQETLATNGLEDRVCYEGKWVSVEGGSNGCIEIFLPVAWREQDAAAAVEDEDAAFVCDETAYYAVAGGNGTWGMYITWTALDEAKDVAALQQEYAERYADAAVVTINDVDFVRYTDTEKDIIALLWPQSDGVHTIAFGPASDTDVTAYVEDIITTIEVSEGEPAEE